MASFGSGGGSALAKSVVDGYIDGAIAAGLGLAGVCQCGVEKIGGGVLREAPI